MIRCSNPECESRQEETPMFTLNVTVDEDCRVCESLHKVEAQFFTCVYCQDTAEDGVWLHNGSPSRPRRVWMHAKRGGSK